MNRLLAALATAPLVLARTGCLYWQQGDSCPCLSAATVTAYQTVTVYQTVTARQATVSRCETDGLPLSASIVTTYVWVQPQPAPRTVTVTRAAAPQQLVAPSLPPQQQTTVAVTPDPDAGPAEEPLAVLTPLPTGPPPVNGIDHFQTLTKTVPGGGVQIIVINTVTGQAACRKDRGGEPCDEDPAASSKLLCPPVVNSTSVATLYKTVFATRPHNATARATGGFF